MQKKSDLQIVMAPAILGPSNKDPRKIFLRIGSGSSEIVPSVRCCSTWDFMSDGRRDESEIPLPPKIRRADSYFL